VTRNQRLTVEKLINEAIDVRELKRSGIFRDNWVAIQAPFRWFSIERMRVSRYLIQLELVNRSAPQQIRVSWTCCNYGGARPWMHCPHCQRRIARLFTGMGGYFCRACLGNPIYESQRRSRKARAYLRAYRLRQRLGGSRPLVDCLPPRPYRMKQRQYRKLVTRIGRLESSLTGSKVLRYAPEFILPLVY
jgi:sarcosine oxidase delta subunit